MWPAALKLLGGCLLTFALVWALVLGWWQSNDHEPSKLDLGLYLVALPLALVGGYLLLRGFIDHLKAPPLAGESVAPELRDDDPLAQAAARSEAEERRFAIGLVASHVLTAAGDSVDDLLLAIEEGKRPELSSRLADDSGFPVFAAEVAGLDVDGMVERMAGETGALRDCSGSEQVMRSLSLLARILAATNDTLRDLLDRTDEPFGLRVLLLVPSAWRHLDLSAMKTWLQDELSSLQGYVRPDAAIVPVPGALEALKAVDEINLRTNRDPSSRELTVLLGVVSDVDEQSVAAKVEANRLFTAEHQQRQIPGEGAVALLLAGRPLISQLQLEDSVLISRLNAVSRDKPVDSGGRVSGKLISQLTSALLDVTGIEHAAIKSAVLDTDHRASYLSEALEGLDSGLAHLDPIRDCLPIGATAGDLGQIGGLVTLACAKARVLATEAPALCISNQHSLGRAVLLATPFPAEPAIHSGGI